jgi:glycerol-3-phosphate O-acyltransferase/dihydroxyacetone phosphate acyltransferase
MAMRAVNQLAVFFVLLLLTIDEINPVKVVVHVFPSIAPWHFATLCILLMAYIFFSSIKEVFYFSVKIFFHSILSIFFREVQVIGRENIPRFGPCIFTVNHANQFMDAVMVFSTCEHKISYLMAEASWRRRIVGDIAWAMDVVPVKRAQDSAKRGNGMVSLATLDRDTRTILVIGRNTFFVADLSPGDKIRIEGSAVGLKVLNIEGDHKMTVDGIDFPEGVPLPDENVGYDILGRVDTKVVFEKVLDKLTAGGAVGIFPEGGSHDRTELLPLKAGVALIAYSAFEKIGQSVPIVPVGLNYFRAHRWRGRAVIEYGQPISLNPKTMPDYEAGGLRRRNVCNQLLENIETSMKSVIVSTPDFETLELIHTARRLYQRKTGPMNISEKQDLSRRFAEGYKRLLLMTNGKPPTEWLDLQSRVVEYRNELKHLGLKDYQVNALVGEHLDATMNVKEVDGDVVLSFLQLPYHIVHLLLLVALAAVPVMLLNLPVGVLAGLYAEQRRKRALAKSKVKIHGYDVMLTEKVMFCIVMVPLMWMFYGFLLFFLTELDRPTIALGILSMPLFSYTGIVAAEAGMVDLMDLRPFFMRLFPSARRRLAALPEKRRILQKDLRGKLKWTPLF